MKRFQRSDRVTEEILKEISSIIQMELKDPRLEKAGLISVTRVELSRDIRNATVFISILGKEENAAGAMAALESASGYIRSLIGKRMHIRTTPELKFRLDDSITHSAKISKLLKEDAPDEEEEP